MQLVERREMIEYFLKELLLNVDYELYEPLSQFIDATNFIGGFFNKLKLIIKYFRFNLAKKSLNQRLFRFYSKELLNFIYRLENGIDVYNIDDPLADGDDARILTSSVLWLDVCEEPGLSRICLAPRSIFELTKDYEDERLANGIFLSDIAEVRRGCSSHSFRRSFPFLYNPHSPYSPHTQPHPQQQSSSPKSNNSSFSFSHNNSNNDKNNNVKSNDNLASWIDPERCLSIVGSERTLAVQLVGDDHETPIPRLQLIDLLSLYSLQSLTATEIRSRGRKFRRLQAHSSVKVLPPGPLAKNIIFDAERIAQLLVTGIDVDEENFSPHFGTKIVAKHLSYDERTHQLHVRSPSQSESQSVAPPEVKQRHPPTPQTDNEEDVSISSNSQEIQGNGGQMSSQMSSQVSGQVMSEQQVLGVMPHLQFGLTGQDRTIDLDDISEVRPGKVSASVDGSEDLLYVSIIASQSIIVLPVPSLIVRDNLVSRFQAFVTVYRDFKALDSDSPALFRPLETTGSVADFTPILAEDLASFLTPPTKNSLSQTMKVTFSNLSAKNAEDEQRVSSSGQPTSVGGESAITAARRRHSASGGRFSSGSNGLGGELSPPVLTTATGTVYSHTKRTKSISILRRSSTSSRGQSSLSEAFNNNLSVNVDGFK